MVWNVLILKCFSNGMKNVVELYLPQVCAWFIDLFLIFFLSGTWSDESEWSLNHQEKAEGHAEGPREAGEAAGKTREGGSTQCKTAAVQWLRLLRRHFSDYALHKVHHHAQSGEKCFVFVFFKMTWHCPCQQPQNISVPGAALCCDLCLYCLFSPKCIIKIKF